VQQAGIQVALLATLVLGLLARRGGRLQAGNDTGGDLSGRLHLAGDEGRGQVGMHGRLAVDGAGGQHQ